MRIDILTIFPEMFTSVLSSSICGKAIDRGNLQVFTHNIRDYSQNKHKNTDDYPFGGGAGMVMLAQPIFDCIEAVKHIESEKAPYVIMMSPRGKTLTQDKVQELANHERLMLLCGHYEGIDERVMELVHEEISIGDYVLTGGEIPAMVLLDCVSRYVDGVLGSCESVDDESFTLFGGLLEYPQYTRPSEFRGMSVPEVLLNGNHAEINKWRRQQAIIKTVQNRPDLLKRVELTKSEQELVDSILKK
ncbi:MAG: tRNA (guanosine(37)-N1)-methyltransferase TrmD [Clostridiales bacterium]|nr:tRNA (guanosine(37)-N1)-methyltransferase TrmD [Clostridiales bacterium]